MNGLINLLFPPFDQADALLSPWLPAWLRLVLFGTLSAAVTMALYRRLSDQAAIRQHKQRMKALQQKLRSADDDLAAVLRLSRENIAVAFGLLGRVAGPALLSSLPLVAVIGWLAVHWSHDSPIPGTPVAVEMRPDTNGVALAPTELVVEHDGLVRLLWPEPPTALRLVAGPRTLWEGTADTLATTAEVGRPAWWSVLIGNPAGYLPADGPLALVTFAVPRREVIPFGPSWIRGWEFLYFATVVAVSLGLKAAFRIA